MPISLILGTGHWGLEGIEDAKTFAEGVKSHGSVIKTLDTAALYPWASPGASEKTVGTVNYAQQGFAINTKALFYPQGGCYGSEPVQKSVKNSLQSLNVAKVNVFFAHAPDRETPVVEQALAFNNEYEKGHFDHLGLANLDVEMLKEWISVAHQKGYVKPSVYQGQYNILCREHEQGVLPIVRQHGMKFMAYSPLAGGFLSGAPTFAPASDLVGTRFEHTDNHPNHGPFYHAWYNKDSMHAAVKELEVEARKYEIQMTEIAIRWLVHHSALRDGDSIIIGPENLQELDGYVTAYHAGPLPDELVKKIEGLQTIVGEDTKAIIQF